MKLVQEPAFSPIALVFETADEAEAFWAIIRHAKPDNEMEREMLRDISNMFSEEAKL